MRCLLKRNSARRPRRDSSVNWRPGRTSATRPLRKQCEQLHSIRPSRSVSTSKATLPHMHDPSWVAVSLIAVAPARAAASGVLQISTPGAVFERAAQGRVEGEAAGQLHLDLAAAARGSATRTTSPPCGRRRRSSRRLQRLDLAPTRRETWTRRPGDGVLDRPSPSGSASSPKKRTSPSRRLGADLDRPPRAPGSSTSRHLRSCSGGNRHLELAGRVGEGDEGELLAGLRLARSCGGARRRPCGRPPCPLSAWAMASA